MGRGLSEAFKTALGQDVLYYAFFAEFQFDSATTRLWTGDADISADLGDGAVTWTGSSVLGSFEFSGEGEDIEARGCTFNLNGVDKSYYNTAIATNYRGRPARLWFALLNSAMDTVLYHYLIEGLRMDTLAVQESEDSIILNLKCESKLVDLFRARRVLMNNFWHHKTYPSDNFYEFVPRLPSFDLPWGNKR